MLGEAGKQEILQLMFQKFQISNRLPSRYFPKIDVGCSCSNATKRVKVRLLPSRPYLFSSNIHLIVITLSQKNDKRKKRNRNQTGAPNDGFLLNALKTLFSLSRVLLDYFQKYILIGAMKFISVRSSQGNLSLFEITRASVLSSRKFQMRQEERIF